MRIDKKAAPILLLLAVSLPFLISFANLKAIAFDINFYEKEFEKYNPEVENATEITRNLLDYLKNKQVGESYIKEFSEEERLHLKEVKNRFQTMFTILEVSILAVMVLLVALYYVDKKKFLGNIAAFFMLKGFGMIIIGLFFIYSYIRFEEAFTRFHQTLLFGQWQFSPGSKLVTLFPAQFFIDITKRLFINTLIIAAIVLGIGLMFYYLNKKLKL